ncbi:MAG: DNA methyltransferase [Chloroflexota bacterium]|jgi:DNA modification methylase
MKAGRVEIGYERICDCPPNHINCLDAKSWNKYQIGIWQFYYSSRDVRDKSLHPAAYPISLAQRVIELFTHRGELVLDPFVGSGTTLVAARDTGRNSVGFDLKPEYVELARSRLEATARVDGVNQHVLCEDARNIGHYLAPDTVSLILTSPPYANLLNRKRKNKSRQSSLRKNGQFLRVEQYSQDPRDLGTLDLQAYSQEIATIFRRLLPLLRPRAHCVINVPDIWWENERITLHVMVIESLRSVGYELRNTIIWDRTNIVNRIGIFGWPSNYITMGTTFEYLLDFWRPPTE